MENKVKRIWGNEEHGKHISLENLFDLKLVMFADGIGWISAPKSILILIRKVTFVL